MSYALKRLATDAHDARVGVVAGKTLGPLMLMTRGWVARMLMMCAQSSSPLMLMLCAQAFIQLSSPSKRFATDAYDLRAGVLICKVLGL